MFLLCPYQIHVCCKILLQGPLVYLRKILWFCLFLVRLCQCLRTWMVSSLRTHLFQIFLKCFICCFFILLGRHHQFAKVMGGHLELIIALDRNSFIFIHLVLFILVQLIFLWQKVCLLNFLLFLDLFAYLRLCLFCIVPLGLYHLFYIYQCIAFLKSTTNYAQSRFFKTLLSNYWHVWVTVFSLLRFPPLP